MTERSNEQWLSDLAGPPEIEASALDDLRRWLRQRLFFYLRSRSDLDRLEDQEIEAMADDFVQEALLQIRANLDQFAGRSKFTTWASKIAVNAALAELRRARWRDFSLDALMGDAEFTPAFLIQGSGPGSPDTSAVQAEALQAVAAAINEGAHSKAARRLNRLDRPGGATRRGGSAVGHQPKRPVQTAARCT